MLKEYQREIEYCTYCPKMCRFSCPVGNATAKETTTPWGRMSILYLVKQGYREWDREVAALMEQCVTCMICREYCDHEIDVPGVMLAARAESAKRGIITQEIDSYRAFFLKHDNAMGDDLLARLKSILPKRYFVQDAQVAYFAGCSAIYNFPNNISDTFKVFEKLGIDYVAVYPGKIQCCGAPLRFLGLTEELTEHMRRVYRALRKYKVIISGCPTCVYELKVVYPEAGFKLTPRVYHITEFLWSFFQQGKVKVERQYPRPVMYHDPCYLGRYLEVYEAPRRILDEVCRESVIEFSWNRRSSYCCGGGGGLPITHPEVAKAIALERLSEFKEHGDAALVTACPSCQRHFYKHDNEVETLDIVNLVAWALEK
ncbi:MAG TPA: (Fe-S)-binding protein [Proteobacteria bacterium]|nr:(Fe-S)-binding protein [Pseudomonadota bacterium]